MDKLILCSPPLSDAGTPLAAAKPSPSVIPPATNSEPSGNASSESSQPVLRNTNDWISQQQMQNRTNWSKIAAEEEQRSLANRRSVLLSSSQCFPSLEPPSLCRSSSYTLQPSNSYQDSSHFQFQAPALSDSSSAVLKNRPSEMGNRSSGITNQSSGITNQSSGITNQSSGITNQSSGITNQSSGITNQSSGITNQSSGITNQSSGITNQSSGITNQSSGITNQSSGLTNQSNGITNQSNGITNQSNNTASKLSNPIENTEEDSKEEEEEEEELNDLINDIHSSVSGESLTQSEEVRSAWNAKIKQFRELQRRKSKLLRDLGKMGEETVVCVEHT